MTVQLSARVAVGLFVGLLSLPPPPLPPAQRASMADDAAPAAPGADGTDAGAEPFQVGHALAHFDRSLQISLLPIFPTSDAADEALVCKIPPHGFVWTYDIYSACCDIIMGGGDSRARGVPSWFLEGKRIKFMAPDGTPPRFGLVARQVWTSIGSAQWPVANVLFDGAQQQITPVRLLESGCQWTVFHDFDEESAAVERQWWEEEVAERLVGPWERAAADDEVLARQYEELSNDDDFQDPDDDVRPRGRGCRFCGDDDCPGVNDGVDCPQERD